MKIRKALTQINWFVFLILILNAISVFAQRFKERSEQQIAAEKISLFPLSVFDPFPEPSSNWPDTANFKPENFKFPSIDRLSLEDHLAKGIPSIAPNCKPSWGVFCFRVNASGKVDSTVYDGNLNVKISNKILKNIKGTSGLWQVSKNSKPTNVAWFIYPVFDFGRLYDEKSDCSETDKLLQKTVWSLSNLVNFIHAYVDRDYIRATMLSTEKRNGMTEPKL